MVGNPTNNQILNTTLFNISKLLNESSFGDWFIAYGTLLGIIRDNTCISHDDDIDIFIAADYDVVKNFAASNGYTFDYGHGIGNSKYILKTIATDSSASIDFYFCEVNDHGDFYSWHERCHYRSCYIDGKIPNISWMNTTVNIPANAEGKLNALYSDWKTPSREKSMVKDIP